MKIPLMEAAKNDPKIDLNQLDLSLLQFFHSVVSAGGFGKAARRGGISQPSLSLKIQRLEQQVGLVLLKRESRSVELTEPGRIVYEFYENLLRQIQEVEESLSRVGKNPRGVHKLEIGQSIRFETVLPFVGRLIGANPEVDIEVAPARTLMQSLAEGRLDAVICHEFGRDARFIYHRIRLDELILVSKPGQLVEGGAQTARLICPTRGTPLCELAHEICDRSGLRFAGALYVSGMGNVLQMAVAGLGAAFVCRDDVEPELKSGALVQSIERAATGEINRWLVTRNNRLGKALSQEVIPLLS